MREKKLYSFKKKKNLLTIHLAASNNSLYVYMKEKLK